MDLGDVILRVVGDLTKVKADITKIGDDPAVAKAGTTAGNRFVAGAKAALPGIATAGGAAFGALVGIAAKGGAELTAAVASYRAETGATAEEAEVAQASISKLYKNNLNGFEELGAVLASVKTNLGLTGEEGEAAAQRILDYAKVTGQDAVQATEGLDDLLDSLNLSYAEGSGLLDQLVASHQKYGGSVEANQAALSALAPALNAANLSVDDGVGLLNLFAASGIDAAAAPQALTKALTKVKSPEELKALIADISATEDPFLRAQKAADLFGAKAGAKLANALDGVDFATFTIDADAASGAIERASDVIDKSPLNQLKLAVKGIGGALADVGTKFGPVILGLGQLANPKILTGITTLFGGLAGTILPALGGLVPALGAAMTAAGTALGGLLAAAIPIGMALLPVLLVAAIGAAIIFLVNNPEIVQSILDFVTSFIDNLLNFLATLPDLMVEFFGTVIAAIAAALPGLIQGLADIILSLPGKIVALAGMLVSFFAGIAGKLIGAAGNLIVSIVKLYLSIPGKIAGLAGQLIGFFAGIIGNLIGKITGFVGDVVRWVLSIPGKVIGLAGTLAGQFANMATTLLGKVSALVGNIVSWFLSLPGKIASLGGKIVSAIIDGMRSLPGKIWDIVTNAFRNLRIDIGPFHISSSGISIDLPHFASGVTNFAGGLALVGERGPEIVNLPRGSDVIPNDQLGEGMGQGGTHIAFGPMQGFMPIRTIEDIVRPVRQLAQTGYLGRMPVEFEVPGA